MNVIAVENPEIPEVMNMETGEHATLARMVGSNFDQAIQQRMKIKERHLQGNPLYVCSECLVPVMMLMHPESRRFYFKHTLENGRCSAITRGQLSQKEINARKYNGAKESIRHRRMKELVIQSLRSDSCFSDIKSEVRWTGELDGRWRQPDVQALFKKHDGSAPLRVAFEIQLSTTYLDVIAERRIFYRQEGALLFWIFSEFNESGRRLMQDDVFYNNNQNAFLVSEDTTLHSQEKKQFHLDCIWPTQRQTVDSFELQHQLVSFSQLTFNVAEQLAYHYDVKGSQAQKTHSAENKIITAEGVLRDEFEKFWIARAEENLSDQRTWKMLVWKFKQANVELPKYPNHLPSALLYALYSVKHGRSISWDYPKLVQLAHWIVAKYPQYLRLFRKALFVYKRGAQLEAEDLTGKWREKVTKYKIAIKANHPKYAADTAHDTLIAFLFPEFLDDNGSLTNAV